MKCLYVYFVTITVISASVPQDLCDTCVPTQDCPLFENLNITEQLKWMQEFPCGPRPNNNAFEVPAGFASAAKGDYVCCSSNVWGIEKPQQFGPRLGQETASDSKSNGPSNSDNYYQNNYNSNDPKSNTPNKPLNNNNISPSNHNDNSKSTNSNYGSNEPIYSSSGTIWFPDRTRNYDNTDYWLTHEPGNNGPSNGNGNWNDNPSENQNIRQTQRPQVNEETTNRYDPPSKDLNSPDRNNPPSNVFRPPIQYDPYDPNQYDFPGNNDWPPFYNDPPENTFQPPNQRDFPGNKTTQPVQTPPANIIRPPIQYDPYEPPNQYDFPENNDWPPFHNDPPENTFQPPNRRDSPEIETIQPTENYPPANIVRPPVQLDPIDSMEPSHHYNNPGNDVRRPGQIYPAENIGKPPNQYEPPGYNNAIPPTQYEPPSHIGGPPNQNTPPGYDRGPHQYYRPETTVRTPNQYNRPPNHYVPPENSRPPNQYLPPDNSRPPNYYHPPENSRPPNQYYPPENSRPPNQYLPPDNSRPPNHYHPPENPGLPNQYYPPENSRPPNLYLPPDNSRPPNQYIPPDNSRPPNPYIPPENSGPCNQNYPPGNIARPPNYPPDNSNFIPGPATNNPWDSNNNHEPRTRRNDKYDYNANNPYYTEKPYYNAFDRDNQGNYGGGQCYLTSFPPDPQSDCCGRQLADDDRILGRPNNPNTNQWGSRPRSGPIWRDRRSTDNDTEVTVENRISGGHATELYQYPWTVLLMTTFDYGTQEASFNCGGGLISAKYVLTAGHCVYDKDGSVKSVQVNLAEYDKNTFPKDCKTTSSGKKCVDNIVMYAEEVITHPQYENENLVNDIALLRLRGSAPYRDYVRPICLPTINVDTPQFSDIQFEVAGWGRTGAYSTSIKQSTVLTLVNHNQCKKSYPQLTDKHLCAAGKRGEDTCKGDSGGPLMALYRGRYYVVGIVSGKRADSPCGTSVPSLYTNVYNYVDWIYRTIRP